MNSYDWQQDAVFDHPADLLLRDEMDETRIAAAHLGLVADLLEEEMRADATLETLKDIEARFLP